MINTKWTTNTWGKAQNPTTFKQDGAQFMDAAAKQQNYEDKDIGEILNQVADPNWVDPAKKRQGVGNADLNKDAFFKLMLAQMKHQDPFNPMQSHEMAAQLAQFTSLEQLQNVNMNLEGLKKGQEPAVGYQVLNFIGKSIDSDSSRIIRQKDDSTHDIQFQLGGDASQVRLTILNEAGEKIKVLDVNDLKKGINDVTWQGQDENGQVLGAGEFKVQIEARDMNNKKIAVETKKSGVITGVNYTAQGPILLMGKQAIRLSDVRKIVDSSLVKDLESQDKSEKIGSPVLQNSAGANDNKIMGAGKPNPVE